jgi:disulfide bond formation protein DsbB
MTRKNLILIATLGSIATLCGAFGFQYIGDMAPCKLCLWQRWPHAVAIVIGILGFATGMRELAIAGMLAALATAGIGVYHTGVEQAWWEGPTTCTSGSIAGLSTEDLLNQIMNAPVVRCDEIAWSLFGISMAAWNAIISFILAGIWLKAVRMD